MHAHEIIRLIAIAPEVHEVVLGLIMPIITRIDRHVKEISSDFMTTASFDKDVSMNDVY